MADAAAQIPDTDLAAQLPSALVTASGKNWRMRSADGAIVAAIKDTTGASLTLARVLAARGVSAEDANRYLSPSLRDEMPDPLTLKDMDLLVDRVVSAIRKSECIWIFGDYDVDGATASAILQLYFRWAGVASDVYLPDRLLEGYGPSIEAFKTIHENGAQLLITVDCGATSFEPVRAAADAGLDVIVIDHHQMHGSPPEDAKAVVNPNRVDDISGLESLSAAGLAFMAVAAINRRLREDGWFDGRSEPDLRNLLDLAALGLVCDVMPLKGLTRTIVKQGARILSAPEGVAGNAGLKKLASVSGAKAPYGAYELGFLIGPRINAAGRIGHANLALDLLTTEDIAKRNAAAEKLHELNAARQEIEAAVQADAIREVETRQLSSRAVIVVAGEGWHPGVIGIVAGRLKEKYNRPTVVIALDENGIGKGSGRSLAGVDLGAAISKAREEGLLVGGGGHAMAAGLTIERSMLERFAVWLERELARDVRLALDNAVLLIDAVVSPLAVTAAFANDIAEAGPFGAGNPEPVFMLNDVSVLSVRRVGSGHLACQLSSRAGEIASAIAFRASEEPLGALLQSGERLHLVGKIRPDAWRGGNAGQFQIVDAATASNS